MKPSALGLFGKEYAGYFDGDPQWFSTATFTGSSEIRNEFNIPVAPNGVSYEWFGYFKPLSADDFTFSVGSDDEMYMWIGNSALSGNSTVENRLLSAYGFAQSAPIALRADTYYPVRVQWGHPVEPTASALSIAAIPALRPEANDFTAGNLFHDADATWTLYRGFYIRINQLLDSGDPSVNQIVFSNSISAPVGQNRTIDTNNDDFYVSGINQANTVAIVNLYGNELGVPIPLTFVKNFAHTYIDNVLHNGNTLRNNIEGINTAFYANSAALIECMPEDTLEPDFPFYAIQAVYREPIGGAVFYFKQDFYWETYETNLNHTLVVAGSGYQENDQFVIPGNILGGSTPENDCTVTVTGVGEAGELVNGNYSFSGTANAQATPAWYIPAGTSDQYDHGNYLGTNRSRCTFTASTDSNQNFVVTNVAEGELSPFQSVWVEEDGNFGRFTEILWQLDGTPGKEGLYDTGNYGNPPPDLPSKVRHANAITYGVNQTLTAFNAFGPGSSYGSMYINSIFSMVAVNADISTFYYNGEFGADSSGTKVLTPFVPEQQDNLITQRNAKYATATESGANRFRRLFSLGYV